WTGLEQRGHFMDLPANSSRMRSLALQPAHVMMIGIASTYLGMRNGLGLVPQLTSSPWGRAGFPGVFADGHSQFLDMWFMVSRPKRGRQGESVADLPEKKTRARHPGEGLARSPVWECGTNSAGCRRDATSRDD